MLHRAVDWMRSGDHQKAIQQLEATLAKDPSSAAYVDSLLGYEFMWTDQVAAAINCFEQAVLLLPHDPSNHHNFAVSLVVPGDYARAKKKHAVPTILRRTTLRLIVYSMHCWITQNFRVAP